MDSEKKFKLDELPDEKPGSSRPSANKPKKYAPTEVDPRLDKLKSLDDLTRVEQMTKRWHFDKRHRLWGWVVFVFGLLVAENSGFYADYVQELAFLDARSMNFGSALYEGILGGAEFLIQHPLVFTLLTPFLFGFTESSDVYFDVTFDGILAPKKVNLAPKELLSRVTIRWGDIVDVKMVNVEDQRPVLILLSHNGPMGELIWDFDLEKKRALKLLMSGLIPQKHPLRIYLEKELK